MCRCIESHFHDCIDLYGVAFQLVTRMGLYIIEILGVRRLWQVRIHKKEDSWYKKLLPYFNIYKRLPFHSGLAQKRKKMGSIIGHNIS